MSAIRTRCLLSVQPTADGGGSETALIATLRRLASEGWTCHVAVPAWPRLADEYAAAGATVHVVGMRRLTTSAGAGYWLAYALAWPVAVGRLAWLARRGGADVVHSNSLHCWYGWAAALLARRPHVWHAREIVTQSGLALRVERLLTRRFAARVVAVSEAVAAQLPGAPVEVLTDEADPAVFFPARAGRWRAGAGVGEEVPVVGSVARLDTWKGFDTLLDAVPAIRSARPEVTVVVAGGAVAGKEGYAEALADRADRLGVRWLGPRRDVADLLADLDVFVQVSSTPEPWGMAVVEALACGVPVVAGDQGGPVEILAGAGPGAGTLVTPSDPAALASAVITRLGAWRPGVEARRARRPLRPAQADDPGFGAILDAVLSRCRGLPGPTQSDRRVDP